MTALRIYGLIWLLVLVASGVSYVMDLISAVTLPIFGFVFSTLVIMAFVALLPALLDEHHLPKRHVAKKF